MVMRRESGPVEPLSGADRRIVEAALELWGWEVGAVPTMVQLEGDSPVGRLHFSPGLPGRVRVRRRPVPH